MNNAGQRIQYIQTKLKINNAQLSEIRTVTDSTISRWHKLEELTQIVKKKLYPLWDKYDINIDWIETGEGKPFLKDGQKAKISPGAPTKKQLEEKVVELENKNEMLRENVILLENIYDLTLTKMGLIVEANERLEKENEELKKENEELKKNNN